MGHRADATIRDLIEFTISSRYHGNPLTRDASRPLLHEAAFSAALMDDKSLPGMAVSAKVRALELVAAVPVRFCTNAIRTRALAAALRSMVLAE